MAFGRLSDASEPMSDMNVIPLVDVMLVLLVIFIVTAPIITHSVQLELPRASSTPNHETLGSVTLALNAQGELFWEDTPIPLADLSIRLHAAVAGNPELAVFLRADRDTRYEVLAQLMALVQRAGVARMAFVSQPERD